MYPKILLASLIRNVAFYWIFWACFENVSERFTFDTFTIVKNQSLASANIWSSIDRLPMFPLTFANCAFPMSRTYLGICLVCFSARMCPLLSSVCICAVSRIPSSLCSLRQSDFLASFSLPRPCPGKKEFDQSGTAWLLYSSPLKTISMYKGADMG